jgi:hypothetical protein
VISKTLSTKVSSWSIQQMRVVFQYPTGSQRNVERRPKIGAPVRDKMEHDEN